MIQNNTLFNKSFKKTEENSLKKYKIFIIFNDRRSII